jgi:hypothetical protein
MKKIALTIAAVASLGLAACSGGEPPPTRTPPRVTTTETTNEAVMDTNAASADANAIAAAETLSRMPAPPSRTLRKRFPTLQRTPPSNAQ